MGVYTALITPFLLSDEIDYPALTRVLDQQIRLGIRKFVVCGTTGESSTLSLEEKRALFAFVLDYGRGKNLELVAGTGTNDTRETIALTRLAETIGYRKFLIVVPYYNKPSQEGLRQHFLAVSDACVKPESQIILYNVPGRTSISLEVETITALAAHKKICAIKEASGDIKFLLALQNSLANANRSLTLLSGDDATYCSFLRAGGEGVISVSSHICPTAMLEIEKSIAQKDFLNAEKIHKHFLPIFTDLFVESNPGPLKWMMARLSLCENQLRLPLVPIQPAAIEKLGKTLDHFRIEEGEFRI